MELERRVQKRRAILRSRHKFKYTPKEIKKVVDYMLVLIRGQMTVPPGDPCVKLWMAVIDNALRDYLMPVSWHRTSTDCMNAETFLLETGAPVFECLGIDSEWLGTMVSTIMEKVLKDEAA